MKTNTISDRASSAVLPKRAERFARTAFALCCATLFWFALSSLLGAVGTAYADEVSDAHGFAIEGHQIVFTGLCADCRQADLPR